MLIRNKDLMSYLNSGFTLKEIDEYIGQLKFLRYLREREINKVNEKNNKKEVKNGGNN